MPSFEPRASAEDDPRLGSIEPIEGRIEALQDEIETCRKAMLVARVAIVGGAALFLANLGLVWPASLTLALLAFTAMIGGVVWLGANKTSREEALTALRLAEAEWKDATDRLAMAPVGNGHAGQRRLDA